MINLKDIRGAENLEYDKRKEVERIVDNSKKLSSIIYNDNIAANDKNLDCLKKLKILEEERTAGEWLENEHNMYKTIGEISTSEHRRIVIDSLKEICPQGIPPFLEKSMCEFRTEKIYVVSPRVFVQLSYPMRQRIERFEEQSKTLENTEDANCPEAVLWSPYLKVFRELTDSNRIREGAEGDAGKDETEEVVVRVVNKNNFLIRLIDGESIKIFDTTRSTVSILEEAGYKNLLKFFDEVEVEKRYLKEMQGIIDTDRISFNRAKEIYALMTEEKILIRKIEEDELIALNKLESRPWIVKKVEEVSNTLIKRKSGPNSNFDMEGIAEQQNSSEIKLESSIV